jgi:hypothetical protein
VIITTVHKAEGIINVLTCSNRYYIDFYSGRLSYCEIKSQQLNAYENFKFSNVNPRSNTVRFSKTTVNIIPDEAILASFPKFTALQIWNGGLLSVEENDFAKLIQLEVLDLSDNEIYCLNPKSLSKLRHLKRFSLRNNKLTTLGDIFVNNRELSSVDFRFNQITKIHPKLFELTENVYEVEFDGNNCVDAGFSKNYKTGPRVFSMSKLKEEMRMGVMNYESDTVYGLKRFKRSDSVSDSDGCVIDLTKLSTEMPANFLKKTKDGYELLPPNKENIEISTCSHAIIACNDEGNHFEWGKFLSSTTLKQPFK